MDDQRAQRGAGAPYNEATGTELFKGCIDRRRDRSCKGDPSGTLSLTAHYWALYGSADPASLIWGACWHPVVAGTGDFAGAQGVVMFVDSPTPRGVETDYIGTLTLAGARASSSRVAKASGAYRDPAAERSGGRGGARRRGRGREAAPWRPTSPQAITSAPPAPPPIRLAAARRPGAVTPRPRSTHQWLRTMPRSHTFRVAHRGLPAYSQALEVIHREAVLRDRCTGF